MKAPIKVQAGQRVPIADDVTTLTVSVDSPSSNITVAVLMPGKTVEMSSTVAGEWHLPITPGSAVQFTEIVIHTGRDGTGLPTSSIGQVTINIGDDAVIVPISSNQDKATILADFYIGKNGRMLKIRGDGYINGWPALLRQHGLPYEPPPQPQPYHEQRPDQSWQDRAPPSRRNTQGSGSGVVIGQGLVISNHHVVDGSNHISVLIDGQQTPAHVLATDEFHDLALIKCLTDNMAPVAFRDPMEAHLGEEVIAAGFPLRDVLGDDLKLTAGNVSGLRGFGDDISRFQFTAPIASGSSGGAVIDTSGRLVGVVCAALAHENLRNRGGTSENVNFAIKASLVREMLIACGREPGPNMASNPLSRAELARVARSTLVSVLCG